MANKWEHTGPGGHILDRVIDTVTLGVLGTKEVVRNTETGEYREVYVGHDQKVGDAVAKGQFIDKT